MADVVSGRVRGDPELKIRGIRPFQSAQPGDLTLAVEKSYLLDLTGTSASAVVVPPGLGSTEKSLLEVDNPKAAFARLLQWFHATPFLPVGVSPLAQVGRGSAIDDRVTIHPFVCVGENVVVGPGVTLFPGVTVGDGCEIGEGCVLHPHVTLYPGVRLGRRVILHAGTVIGADGFGYVSDGSEQVKMPQLGGVRIHDDVEIGANSCVDRATFGETVLERGVKLDNHVHIAHNCRIGENTVIVGQVGVSGSVEIGRNCTLAGHVGISDHVKLGEGVTVLAKSSVTKDVPAHSVVSGNPALDHRRRMKIEALVRRLPELYCRWKLWLRREDSEKEG